MTDAPQVTSRAAGRRYIGWSRSLAPALAALIPLAFLTIFFAWPVVTLIGKGFLTDGSPSLEGFASVFSRARTPRIIGMTLAQAAVATVISLAAALPSAQIAYCRFFPGARALRATLVMPFVMPTVVVGVAFRSLFAESGPFGFLQVDGTFLAVVSSLVFFNYGMAVRIIGSFWSQLDPRAVQAARALGASPARAFRTLTLPALIPALGAAGSLVFLFSATAFGTVLVLGGPSYGTIETEIWRYTTQMLDLPSAAVLSVLQLVMVAAVLWVSAVARRRGERTLQLVDDGARQPLTRTDLPTLAFTILCVLATMLPIATLIGRSFHTNDGWSGQNYANLGTTGGANTLSITVWQAAGQSLRTAALATAIALVIGMLIALVCSRKPSSRAGRAAVSVLDSLFMLPLGVSAVTVGFGFLITLNRPPFDLRSSLILIPIAQAVVAIPLVVRTILPLMRAVDPRLRQAAQTLGAGPVRVFATVDLPVLTRTLGAAAGFAFAVSLGEFGATTFLARPETATLPVVVYRLISRPGAENLGMALAASVILVLMTAAIMAVAEGLRPRAGARE